MPVVAIFAFVDREPRGAMVVSGNLCRKLGLFFCVIANFIYIANPAAFWFVNLVRV